MGIYLNCFPFGKKKALTMSYDDGAKFDRKLVEIFDKYGIRGTFHLNSGKFGSDWNITAEELPQLYKNHEVSVHTVNHPNMCLITDAGVIREVIDDKRNLEQLCGYPVRGMSYPFGTYDERLLKMLPSLGMEYSRTVNSTQNFALPSNFLEWNPTTHHNGNIIEKGKEFLERNLNWERNVFYVWGHSYEFDRAGNWDLIEDFCKQMGGHDEIWYATNIEIVDYVNAVRNLRTTVDEKVVYNPSGISVWVGIEDDFVEIKAGETKRF